MFNTFTNESSWCSIQLPLYVAIFWKWHQYFTPQLQPTHTAFNRIHVKVFLHNVLSFEMIYCRFEPMKRINLPPNGKSAEKKRNWRCEAQQNWIHLARNEHSWIIFLMHYCSQLANLGISFNQSFHVFNFNLVYWLARDS